MPARLAVAQTATYSKPKGLSQRWELVLGLLDLYEEVSLYLCITTRSVVGDGRTVAQDLDDFALPVHILEVQFYCFLSRIASISIG